MFDVRFPPDTLGLEWLLFWEDGSRCQWQRLSRSTRFPVRILKRSMVVVARLHCSVNYDILMAVVGIRSILKSHHVTNE